VIRPDHIEGFVLCQVGPEQIAFPAAAVGRVDAWAPGGVAAPLARSAYRLEPAAGKLLLKGGFTLVVDGLEVIANRLPLSPVPAMLIGAVGGALRGFVRMDKLLIPLLGFAEFSDFVSRRRL
jgi:hypothetical protein